MATTPKKVFVSRLCKEREKDGTDPSPKKIPQLKSPEQNSVRFEKIENLRIGQRNIQLRARVIAKTSVIENETYGKLFNVVLMDETGSIRLVSWGSLSHSKFYKVFQIGKIVTLKNFAVKSSTNLLYTWVANTSQLSMNTISEVLDSTNDSSLQNEVIPQNRFYFTNFNNCYDLGKVIDIVGIVYKTDEHKVGNGKTKYEILLIDEKDAMVTVTLWNEIGNSFLSNILHLDDPIVAFGGLKLSSFVREDGTIFWDSFDDTIISINPELKETNVLRKWLRRKTEAVKTGENSEEKKSSDNES